jgi:hypothetical protein
MHIIFSTQTIDALAEVISGGSQNDPTPSIGIYRAGPKIEAFMRSCSVRMSVGSNSRLPAWVEGLESQNTLGEQDNLRRIAELLLILATFRTTQISTRRSLTTLMLSFVTMAMSCSRSAAIRAWYLLVNQLRFWTPWQRQ